ncbi:Kinesin heavy chain 73 [Carabus blaptoides fortunei]
MSETLEKAILGTDVLLFAYGQTGSGKSCTLSGLQNPYEGRGLIPRIITKLFELKEKGKCESKIKYRVSFVEVTKTSIIDLLQNEKNKNVHTKLRTLELKTEQDGLRYLFQGEGQRKIRYNGYVSNLFTSVFTIHVQNCSTIISNPVDRIAKFHIIDMAGMDCSGNMSCIWKKSQEVGIANLNKSQLEFCLMLMRKELVRTGKFIKDAGPLVNYLKDSLKPQSIIKFIAHINTTRDDLPLTISALKFGDTARRIHCTELTQFVTESSSLIIKSLKNEMADLKKQHDLDSMLLNVDLSYNITQSRLDQMKNAVNDYINDKSNEQSLQNVTDISTVLKIMKDKCVILENEKMDFIKLQNQRRSTMSQKLSKGSVIPVATLNEKGSKTTRTTSYGSQMSRKRKSSDIVSKRSKQNSVLEMKTSLVGNTTRSGISLGQLMSQNFQGNVTKSLKRKSKRIKSIGSKETIIPNDFSNENIEPKISELNLQNILGDNFDEAWNSYKLDENYNYTDMNKDLKTLEESTSDLIKQYVEICKELENTSHLINLKKNDLLKIHLYTDTINFKCKPDGKIRKNETEQDVQDKINQLNTDMILIQEKILTLQTEITIQSTDYHRVKSNIHEDFQKFCAAKFKIKIPFMQQNTDCIEEKILNLEVEKVENIDSEETKQKEIYYKLQEKLKRVQQEKMI